MVPGKIVASAVAVVNQNTVLVLAIVVVSTKEKPTASEIATRKNEIHSFTLIGKIVIKVNFNRQSRLMGGNMLDL